MPSPVCTVTEGCVSTPSAPATEKPRTRTKLEVVVGIATRGRPAVLMDTLAELQSQNRRPDAVVVCFTTLSDIGDARSVFPEVLFLQSTPGLTLQRNSILRAVQSSAELLVFLDDDFYLHNDYLKRMEAVFVCYPRVVVATGNVVADGINGPGLSLGEARSVLNRPLSGRSATEPVPVFNAYGCNMCLRLEPICTQQLWFNEELPLYGWYEDVEFSRQMAQYGDVVKVEDAFGVHLGVKGGRQSGLRLGYSQVANPVYLARRRSVPWSYAIASMLSRSLKNLVFSARPEPFVDRRGRLKGNVRAWVELLKGNVHPLRAADL